MSLPPPLPPPRTPGTYAIAMVCLGNICRSPIAEVVLRERLAAAGLPGVTVSSAGTGDWHVGRPMDERSAQVLRAGGYDPTGHRAQQWVPAQAQDHDLVLAMDEQNLADLGGPSDRVRLFREADPAGPGDVPDPYFGDDDGFEEVLTMVERTADGWVATLARTLTSPGVAPGAAPGAAP